MVGEKKKRSTSDEAFSFSSESSSYNSRMNTIDCHICPRFLQHLKDKKTSKFNF